MSDFRKVKAVALYDAGVLFAGSSGGDSTFHDEDLGSYQLDWRDLADLFKLAGIETTEKALKKERTIDYPFHIIRKTYVYGTDFSDGSVRDVLVRIEGPGMIAIRVIEQWNGESEVAKEFLYSGRFSVEWE